MENEEKLHSERRYQLSIAVAAFTGILSAVWFFLSRSLELYTLSYFIGGTALIFLFCLFLTVKRILLFSRITYMLSLIFSVGITASYVGKAGSVEYVLMFTLGLPFLLFSFRREKVFIIMFSLLSIFMWIGLFFTDFTLFRQSPMDQQLAASVIYPFSVVSTFILVTFQITYFSFLNMRYYTNLHNKREEAEGLSNAKSKFLSMMSHEIRTPLNAVIGLSHILREKEPREDQVENIEALNYSGKLLLNLLNQVLDYSKMEHEEVDLDPIPADLKYAISQIRKVHEPSCIKKGVSFDIDISADLPDLWVDIVRFNQVINNLISNAIKFTDNGQVKLTIEVVSSNDKYVKLLTKVKDSGIGISKEQQERIFQAFTQAEVSTTRLYGGTGLGLPIVKKIVESMGSTIRVESEAGKGSTFSFEAEFPVVQDEDKKFEDIGERFDFNHEHVLLVEDNAINVMVGKQILEDASLNVSVAVDGQEAIDLVKKHTYDLILMDIQMPVVDGYEASREIRKFNTETPILALSASVFMEVKDDIQACGMNGFILKPFEPEQLIKTIYNWINRGKE